MRYAASRIVIVSTVLLLTVALSLACYKKTKAPKETPPPDTVIVSRNGDGQYTTIGEALKGVQPGMRILVRPGVYNEALIIDKPVEIVADLRGAGEQVLLQTLNSSSITMHTDRALVRGFTIRHRLGLMGTVFNILSEKDAPAVDIPSGELVLEDCDIISNSVAGIAIHGLTANPIIRRTRIHDGRSNGVWVYAGGHGTLEDCDISGTYWAGVRIEGGGNPILRRCKCTTAGTQAS
jgi:parallel beta-helix repeat protein